MSTYEKYFERYERGFFASVALSVVISSSLGAIAAMTILQRGTSVLQMIQLFVVVAISMTFNGSVLAQQKPRTVYNLFIASLIVNSLMAILNVWG